MKLQILVSVQNTDTKLGHLTVTSFYIMITFRFVDLKRNMFRFHICNVLHTERTAQQYLPVYKH